MQFKYFLDTICTLRVDVIKQWPLFPVMIPIENKWVWENHCDINIHRRSYKHLVLLAIIFNPIFDTVMVVMVNIWKSC